jgi:N6-L-threonylcarbamoyladenine synthase
MEGHVLSSIFDKDTVSEIIFPALALLISGGHTELVLLKDWTKYELVGQTRDDAVGEAFDKVARMLELPYPGGPEISKLAGEAREKDLPTFATLPRPMLDSGNSDLSFSGLKTAVKYAIKDKELTDDDKVALARDFEDAVVDVLLKKTAAAVSDLGIESLIIGGGVSANRQIREVFLKYFQKEYPTLTVYLPEPSLSTDNSIMIALAGHARAHEALAPEKNDSIRADGNRSLSPRQPAKSL